MRIDKMAKIDLNLLVTLQILLEECSVTRAANRLHLSQSALSKNLNRLRQTLGDPLFFRSAHGLKPTAHALQLQKQLPLLLQNLYQLTLPPKFTPQESQRKFSFALLESAYETLLPAYISPLLEKAPKIKLDIYSWNENSMRAIQQGKIDFGLSARDLHPDSDFRLNNLPDGIVFETLFTTKQICLVRKNHPVLNNNDWNKEQYLKMTHVQVRCEGKDWWALDYHLAASNEHRKINITLPDFYSAASICAHSDLILTLPLIFAPLAQRIYALEQLPLPVEFPELAYVLLWHQRNTDEPGHQWVRELINENIQKVV
ncbi:regulatory protein LysR:LysR substrate-binding protein [Psychromonas sp. CNPT3]|uniref:LysR family transcriptional regulator n=1 Tax=Psychromonas sp. CNPT3 TaxID=314282 RepID=UPI00006E9133|nr:LysR family transcriptional regulator [Psychromonas sp. CNPT3]AGH81862.1 regulatory protein LysR:LysR substrate-binding protein [Psychromonas sp. CNPT3]